MDVRLDAFPVNVTTPEGTHARARLLVVGQRALVFTALRRQPQLVASADVATLELGYPHVLGLADGTTWKAANGGGCGCGNPLKHTGAADLLALADA